MRITSLEVDGFGVWNGLGLENLSDGLNVFYGPNEAGKSTLMQFVRSLLYGFEPQRGRYLPPVHGGKPGGSLWLAGPNGRFHISRHENEEDAAGGDLISISGADGTRQGEHLLPVLLCNIDEPVFNNVFSLGLRELQELGTLDDTDAAAMLYSLSSGLDRVPLVDVMRQLVQSRNHLLDAQGGPCQISKLFEQRETLRAEIEELGGRIHEFGRLTSEREQLDREIRLVEEEHGRYQHEARVVEIAGAVSETWADRDELTQQLDALGAAETLPEGIKEQLGELNERLEVRRHQTTELRRRWDTLRDEANSLDVNESLWRLTPRIEALQEQGDWIVTLKKRIAELEAEIHSLESRRESEHRKIGLSSDDPTALTGLSSRTLGSLRQPARAIRQCRTQLAETEAQAEESRVAAQSLSLQVESTLRERGETNLNEAVQRVGGLVAQLRRCLQVDQRLAETESYGDDLQRQSRDLLDQQVISLKAMVTLGAVIVSGVVFTTLGLVGTLHWIFVILGLGAVAGGVAVKFASERANARRLEGCQNQVAMLQAQRKQASEERDAIVAQLPSGEGSTEQRLEAAEAELAALEDLVPLESQSEASEREAADADERYQVAERDLNASLRRWKESLRIAGLPTSLSPKQVREMAAVGEAMGDVQRRLELRYEELGQRTRELESLTSRIDKLVADSGLRIDAEDLVEKLQMLGTYVEEQEIRLKSRHELKGLGKQLRRKKAKLDASVGRLNGRRQDLLRSIGATGETEFQQRIETLERHASLRRDRDALQAQIDATIAGYCGEEAVAEQLSGERSGNLDTILQQIDRRKQAASDKLKGRFERRGRLTEQLEVLAESRAVLEKQRELGVVEAQMKEAVRRWRVRAVACRVLDTVRETYEQQRQPETLLQASEILERLTGGRYVRVWTPLGENVLRVDDAEGNSLPVEALSRGTREQLFLALRLALAASFSRRGASLPMILDDVLVNFDVVRAKAAAAVLKDFAAQGHQLLVFTCHEHVAKMFRAMKVSVQQLPDNSQQGVKLIGEEQPIPKAKKAASKPVVEPTPKSKDPIAEVDPPEEEEVDLPEEEEKILDGVEADESTDAEESWEEDWEEDEEEEWEEDEGEAEEEEEEEVAELEEASSGDDTKRRGVRDEWDDAYEDEYECEEEEEEADAEDEYEEDEDEGFEDAEAA